MLDLSLTDLKPAISGTLAFDKLDLRSFLAAFTSIASGAGNIHDEIEKQKLFTASRLSR